MKDLNYSLKKMCRDNKEGSFSTQSARRRALDLIGSELDLLGYKRLGVGGLKPKHVAALVANWKAKGLSVGTIKNRMSHVRWWARQVGRESVVEKNENLGIEKRVYVDNESKAQKLDTEKLLSIKDEYVAASLRLQAEFGLRREESIKFSPRYAITETSIKLKASWCKGGRSREVPIRTKEQRELLNEISNLAGAGALIRPDRNYVQQLKSYENSSIKAGLCRNHGLRHLYAQGRYMELTGFKCPAAGGAVTKDLSSEQRAADREARLIVSQELGHEREQITAIYLGR